MDSQSAMKSNGYSDFLFYSFLLSTVFMQHIHTVYFNFETLSNEPSIKYLVLHIAKPLKWRRKKLIHMSFQEMNLLLILQYNTLKIPKWWCDTICVVQHSFMSGYLVDAIDQSTWRHCFICKFRSKFMQLCFQQQKMIHKNSLSRKFPWYMCHSIAYGQSLKFDYSSTCLPEIFTEGQFTYTR